MKLFHDLQSPELITILRNGGIGVLRTDTLYGVVARADDEAAVNRVYKLKERDYKKSPIVLIASQDQVWDTPPQAAEGIIAEVWPGPVSVILPSTKAPLWIRRNNASVAYRLPAHEELQALIRNTDPLIAPSANPEGGPPAMTIDQAISYFGDDVDFYVDAGEVVDDTPSRLFRIKDNEEVERLR